MYSICILPKVIFENWLVFKVFKHPLVILRLRGFYHQKTSGVWTNIEANGGFQRSFFAFLLASAWTSTSISSICQREDSWTCGCGAKKKKKNVGGNS